jgi:hypothetical protein
VEDLPVRKRVDTFSHQGEGNRVSQDSSSTWGSTLGGIVAFVLILAWLVQTVNSCSGGEQENQNASRPANRAEESAKKDPNNPPADYDGPATPSEKPIEVVLRVSGSQGGAYEVWQYTEEDSSDYEDVERLVGPPQKPDIRNVLRSEPTEYRFGMDDGVMKDSDGDLVWDTMNVKIEKGERRGQDWEGEVYAELLVDGKEVSCSRTESGWAIRLSWSPEKPKGFMGETLPCQN